MPTAVHMHVDDEADETNGYQTWLDAKQAEQTLLKGLMKPFVAMIQAERGNSKFYLVKNISSVQVNGVDLDLATVTTKSDHSVMAPIKTYICEDGSPLVVVLGFMPAFGSGDSGTLLGMTERSAPMVPSSGRGRVGIADAPGRLSGLFKGSSKAIEVRAGTVALGSKLTRKWVNRSVRDAIILPFMEQFEAITRSGTAVGYEIDKITFSSAPAPSITVYAGSDLDEALDAPVHLYAPGDVLEVTIELRNGSDGGAYGGRTRVPCFHESFETDESSVRLEFDRI